MKVFILPLWGGLIGVSWSLFSLFPQDSIGRLIFVLPAVFCSGGLFMYWVVHVMKRTDEFKIKFKW